MDDIKKIDIYELLGIESDATEQEIKKAYRKKALQCHPDKNPSPKAAEEFRQLSKALEVLCDQKARAAYDKLLRARKEARDRVKNLDSKRRKFRDDLEARERAAREEQEEKERRDEERLAEEIERLRKEGSKVVEEELDLLRSQMEKEILELKLKKQSEMKLPRLKCKWAKKNEYDEAVLRGKFEKCGRISCLVVSKKGAIVEFEKTDAALKAIELASDSLQITWVQGDPSESTFNEQHFKNFDNLSDSRHSRKERVFFDEEYEQKVLAKLQDAYLKQINK